MDAIVKIGELDAGGDGLGVAAVAQLGRLALGGLAPATGRSCVRHDRHRPDDRAVEQRPEGAVRVGRAAGLAREQRVDDRLLGVGARVAAGLGLPESGAHRR